MNTRHVPRTPFRAIPVAIALIFNVVAGPIAPLLQSQIAALAPSRVMGYVGDANTFELDGNATTQSTHDWDQVYADSQNGTSTSAANNTVFVQDVTGQGDDILTGGNTKDTIDLSNWLWKQSSTTSVQDKDDIENAFAASYSASNGHTIGVFGLDRFSIDGDATAGFWFFKDQVGKVGDGSGNGTGFSGVHTEGDILVVIDFTNGGAAGTATIYTWHNGALTLDTSGTECSGVQQSVCAITNLVDTASPWPYTPKSGTANVFPAAPVKNGSQGAGALYEAGIDLTALGLDTGCFSSFLAETRSSQQTTSTLSDFVLGNFSFCEAPTIETQVSASSINMSESVTDTATLSGTKGAVEGSVDFFVCGPTNSAQECSSGGAQVGGSVSVSSGQATSASFTPTEAGFYCFRAEYTPAAGSKYLAASHTNDTTECFQVLPAQIHVTKAADAASVSAGSPIGFTVTVSNSGAGKAFGVTLTDALPGGNAGNPVHWAINGGANAAAFAITGADGSQALSLVGQPITLNAGASLTVHITAATDTDNCAVYDNTASVATTNDGQDQASASTKVLCPDIQVTKVADADSVSAGTPIGFTVTVGNAGDGNATGATLSDSLPGGNAATPVHWTIDSSTGNPSAFAITGADGSQILSLSGQPVTLNAGASLSVHIVAATSFTSCADYDNTATLSSTNDGSLEASDSTAVLCPDLFITKAPDPQSGVVSAGQPIGFSIVVGNKGDGTATGVTLNDPLPAGADLDWAIDPAYSGQGTCDITGSVGSETLSCSFGNLVSGTMVQVHVVSATTTADCSTFHNQASASASNHPTVTASADITVECPGLNVAKSAAVSPIHGGDDASFTIIVWNHGDGTDLNATLNDPLPAGESGGLDWTIDPAYSGPGTCAITGNVGDQTLSCSFGDLPGGTSQDSPSASITVVATTSPADDCATLENTASVSADNDVTREASASIELLCPKLVIEKAADIHDIHFVFNANGSLKSVTPPGGLVTWTLTYTLTDGPVTNAVITDPLPTGLGDPTAISNGGVYDKGTRTITWTFANLSASGVVSFETAVEPTAPDGPIDNVATISSQQTAPDTGEDSIRVTSEQVEAATSTPKASVPNTAVVFGPNGQPIQIPVELLVVLFLGSLGALAVANVRAVRRRR